MKSIVIAHIMCGKLITLTQTYNLALLIAEITEPYNKHYGAGNWLCLDADDLPADFSVDTYTIVDGQLAPASPEIIAERRAIQAIANHAATRIARQQRYDSEAITSLYWNWQESGAKADKAKWLAAKEAIRQELPYPETPTAV